MYRYERPPYRYFTSHIYKPARAPQATQVFKPPTRLARLKQGCFDGRRLDSWSPGAGLTWLLAHFPLMSLSIEITRALFGEARQPDTKIKSIDRQLGTSYYWSTTMGDARRSSSSGARQGMQCRATQRRPVLQA